MIPPAIVAGRTKVRNALAVLVLMSVLVAALPLLAGGTLSNGARANIGLIILSSMAVYRGVRWARWVLVFFSGGIAVGAVLLAMAPGMELLLKVGLVIFSARIMISLHTIFLDEDAIAYLAALPLPEEDTAKV